MKKQFTYCTTYKRAFELCCELNEVICKSKVIRNFHLFTKVWFQALNMSATCFFVFFFPAAQINLLFVCWILPGESSPAVTSTNKTPLTSSVLLGWKKKFRKQTPQHLTKSKPKLFKSKPKMFKGFFLLVGKVLKLMRPDKTIQLNSKVNFSKVKYVRLWKVHIFSVLGPEMYFWNAASNSLVFSHLKWNSSETFWLLRM